MTREITTVSDVNDIRSEIEQFTESWYPGPERVDWDEFLYRMDEYLEISLPDQMLDPVIKRVKVIVRAVRRELRES